MPTLPAKSVDLILCDLPYGMMPKAKWDKPIPFESLWEQYRRIARGPIVLFAQAPFDKKLAVSNLKDFRHEWIWEKSRANGFLTAKKAPLRAHETILVFSAVKPLYYRPQMTEGRKRIKATKKGLDEPLYGDQQPVEYDSTSRYPRSVLKFESVRSPYHPTEKPQDLLLYLIETYCPAGGSVLDNCMGAGSTGIAALNSGRHFIGIEMNPTFFGRAKGRIESLASESLRTLAA